ncbi:MAG TPA: hypothetical protein VHE55_11230 [Fimbriimonadaceae bacterium]|nr:hypothetical protein [Fimbriimonadaceae bacterium]
MSDPTLSAEWAAWPLTEKLAQLAAYHCDVLHVEEEPRGSNRGAWVERYLAAAGAEAGEPWCAAFVTYLLRQCGYGSFPESPAAVSSWGRWAEDHHKIAFTAMRGGLFFLLRADGTGHMGICLSGPDEDGDFRTIEGNSNADGSREGYAVVRRARNASGLRFIAL